jgi:hypothetical protein
VVKSNRIHLLVGQVCSVVFNLPSGEWPISGYPAWVVIDTVEMPLIEMHSIHAGKPIWVNASDIKTIVPADTKERTGF